MKVNKQKGQSKQESLALLLEKKLEIEQLEAEDMTEEKFRGYVDEVQDEFNYD